MLTSLLCAYDWGDGERRASITPKFLGELYNEISQAVCLVRNAQKNSRKMPLPFHSRVDLSGKVPVTHSIPSSCYRTVTTSSLKMEQQPCVVG